MMHVRDIENNYETLGIEVGKMNNKLCKVNTSGYIMNKKLPFLMVLIAVTIAGSMFALDSIDAKQPNENRTLKTKFSAFPVDRVITMRAGESVPMDFIVKSEINTDLEIKIKHLDSKGRQINGFNLLGQDLNVNIPEHRVSFDGIDSMNNQVAEKFLNGTISTLDSLAPGTYQMSIDSFDKSTGQGIEYGFQVIILDEE